MSEKKDNFSALLEISQIIHSILDPTLLLEKILKIAMKHLDADRGFILLRDENNEEGYKVVLAKNFNSECDSHTLAASSSVVKQVLQTGEAVLTYDALSDERFETSRSIIIQQILSILCIPLKIHNVIIGAVYVDSKKSRRAFTE